MITSVSKARGDRVDHGGLVVIILVTGSEVRGFKSGRGRWIFSERKNPEYDFLRKGSKAVGSRFVDLRHVQEPQAEIRASEQTKFVGLLTLTVESDANDLRC